MQSPKYLGSLSLGKLSARYKFKAYNSLMPGELVSNDQILASRSHGVPDRNGTSWRICSELLVTADTPAIAMPTVGSCRNIYVEHPALQIRKTVVVTYRIFNVSVSGLKPKVEFGKLNASGIDRRQ